MRKKAIDTTYAREHAQRYPDGCPPLCADCIARLALSEAEVARRNRARIAHTFKHDGRPRKGVADA